MAFDYSKFEKVEEPKSISTAPSGLSNFSNFSSGALTSSETTFQDEQNKRLQSFEPNMSYAPQSQQQALGGQPQQLGVAVENDRGNNRQTLEIQLQESMSEELPTEAAEQDWLTDTATLIADNVDPVSASNQLLKRAEKVEARGGDATATRQTLQLMQTNPQQAKLAIGNINKMIENKNVRRMMARNPSGAKDFLTGMGVTGMDGKTPVDGVSELNKWKLQEDYKAEIANSKNLKEKKYAEIEKANTSIDADVSAINKNYEKVKNLLRVVKDSSNVEGARQAVYGLIVSLVKLGDPNSAVLAQEAASALNIQGIDAAILSGDVSVIKKALEGKLDALNPDAVSEEGIMQVANAYRNAGVNDLSQRYDYTEEQRGLLGEQGKAFSGSDRRKTTIDKLRNDSNRSLFANAPEIGSISEYGEVYLGGDVKSDSSWRAK